MSGAPISVGGPFAIQLENIDAESVFDEAAPFFDAYKMGYLNALKAEDVRVLDVHREAIYYLKPTWDWCVISALTVCASKHPDANFVESLAFYFSLDERLETFIAKVVKRAPAHSGLLIACLAKLERDLEPTDHDMTTTFGSVRRLLEQRSMMQSE